MEGAGHYEFTSEQNERIAVLASRMTWVGRFLIVFSILAVFGGVIEIRDDGLNAIIQGALLMIVALWTVRAGKSFQQITTTSGADISNLMDALGELRKLYTLQYFVIIVAIVLVVILAIVGGVMAATGSI